MTALDQKTIRQAIESDWTGEYELELFDELPSTNVYLSERATNEPDLATAICVTRKQTVGVGRRGKRWFSPNDSITFSIHQRLPMTAASLMGLSLVTGVAATDVLAELIDDQFALKWPNDILVNHKKLAGILIELPRSDADTTSVITGIGLNYLRGEELEQIDQPYTLMGDLTDRLPPKNQLIGALAGRVLAYYSLFVSGGWGEFSDRWKRRDYLSGKQVEITGGTCQIQGVAKGVASDGGLVVRSNGQDQTFYSGEVSVRSIP